MAARAWSMTMRPRRSESSGTMPPVSTSTTSRSSITARASTRSRVTPGRSWVMALLRLARRLNRVDLPTLGRPMRAMTGGMAAYTLPGRRRAAISAATFSPDNSMPPKIGPMR